MKEFTVGEEQRNALAFQINRRRRMHSMTVSELANRSGVPKVYIKALERGKVAFINPFALMKISEVLEINYLSMYMVVGYIGTYDLAQIMLRAKTQPSINVFTDNWSEVKL